MVLAIRDHLGFTQSEIESKNKVAIEEPEAEQTPVSIKLPKTPAEPSLFLQDNIRGSAFVNRLIFYEKLHPKKVLEYVNKMARKLNPYAQHSLGYHYIVGKGVKQNSVEAFRNFKLAADKK